MAIVIDLSISLDGFIAGPDSGEKYPLGKRGGEHVFDWYQGGGEAIHGDERFRPIGANSEVVHAAFRDYGAMLFGRRTYDITHGWDGTHPFGVPVVVMTHTPPPPAEVPSGRSKLIFVTDGIEQAVRRARQEAGAKDVGIGGASAAQQALAAGLADELLLHVAPILLGDGVRLFDRLRECTIPLELASVIHGPGVTHHRYRVKR